MLPMQVAKYLFLLTLMPAASAVAGFSPTARSSRPILVRLSMIAATIAMAMAAYVINP